MEKQRDIRQAITVKDMCVLAVFAAVISVLSQISIPMTGGVPVTMQTFAVAFTGIVLGGKKGFLSVLVYIMLGIFGLPVFAGFKGGAASLFGVTGGFIMSFPILALFTGEAMKGFLSLSAKEKKAGAIAFLIIITFIGVFINYAVGTLWFVLVTGTNIMAGIAACVAPFLINDIIKLIAAYILGAGLRRRLKKTGLI